MFKLKALLTVLSLLAVQSSFAMGVASGASQPARQVVTAPSHDRSLSDEKPCPFSKEAKLKKGIFTNTNPPVAVAKNAVTPVEGQKGADRP